ncbi:MAG TPA: pyridoxamine 5'-phosphate oxidase family protein [Caulobacteraceae bacterium]|jgi:general stress protein 26|nr:pyridoxamine 5'-phosphate oxidase family protein [Caulobacteraceae bacterium]
MSQHTRAEIEVRLWDEIRKDRTGMLGLIGEDITRHYQPMSAFAEPGEQAMWFFVRDDSDLAVEAARTGGEAMFTFQSKDQTLMACLGGRLSLSRDPERVKKYWNPVAAAWFPDGRDDPRLALLRFDVIDAQAWLVEAGPVKFAWEVAKANVTGRQPDVGQSAHLDMRH